MALGAAVLTSKINRKFQFATVTKLNKNNSYLKRSIIEMKYLFPKTKAK